MKMFTHKIVTWAARSLGIGISAAFVALYIEDHISKAEVAHVSLLGSIFLFLFYLLPWLVPAAVLFVAWRWEIAGGIIYLVVGGLGVFCVGLINLFTPEHPLPWGIVLITAPAFITGLLFLISGIMRRKSIKRQTTEPPRMESPDNLHQ